jgi:hypothetical protein
MKCGFWLGTGFISFDNSHDELQSHGTVPLTAFTNNALAGHLRIPLGPTRPILLPGPTNLLGWLGSWLKLNPAELETRTVLSICSPLHSVSNWSPAPDLFLNWPRAQSCLKAGTQLLLQSSLWTPSELLLIYSRGCHSTAVQSSALTLT